jgi:hypothetical protein
MHNFVAFSTTRSLQGPGRIALCCALDKCNGRALDQSLTASHTTTSMPRGTPVRALPATDTLKHFLKCLVLPRARAWPAWGTLQDLLHQRKLLIRVATESQLQLYKFNQQD